MQPARALIALLLALALLGASPLALAAPRHGRDAGPAATAESAALPAPGNATLVVVVNATGGDAAFPFQATGEGVPAGFTLTTQQGQARISFSGLHAGGAYSLAQSAPLGWRLTRAACDQGAPANVTLVANGTTTCTFDDLRLGALRVRVETLGGDATLAIRATGDDLPAWVNVTTANGSGEAAYTVAPNATHALAPQALAGWNLSGAACTAGAPGNVTVGPGETVTCTFRLARLNTLVVQVNARGGEGTFPFTTGGAGGLPAAFNASTVNGSATLVFADLDTDRAYALHGVVPEGWKRTAAQCTQGEPGNVTLLAGQAATCTFNHTRLGSLALRVLARGGDASFAFTTSGLGGLPAGLTVSTAQGAGEVAIPHVDPDLVHALAHVPLAGWRLLSAACTAGAPHAVNVTAGNATVCTFELTRLGEIRGAAWDDRDRDGVRDAGEAPLAAWAAYLDLDGDGARDAGEPLTVTDATGHYALVDLLPATYLVRQAPAPGWTATAPAAGYHAAPVGDAALVAGLDFGAWSTQPPAPREDDDRDGKKDKDDDKEKGLRGPGFWRKWDAHGKHDRAQLEAWLRGISDASAWLMPHGSAATVGGMVDLMESSTKKCNKSYGHAGCAQKRFEARYLVLRLNVESGRLPWDATMRLSQDEASYLGLAREPTVRQLVDAVEAKAGTQPTRAQHDLLRHAVGLDGDDR